MTSFAYSTIVLVSLSLIMFDNTCFAERGVGGRCQPQMVNGPHGKYCYDIQKNQAKLTWIAAQDFCHEKGGNLITLHSVEEVDFMTRNMAEQQIDAVYLGLRAFENRTKWRWVDDDTEIDPTVANWMPGEPNNQNGAENCGNINNKYNSYTDFVARKILNDVSCDQTLDAGFICKIPLKLRKAKKHRNNIRRHDDAFEGQEYGWDK